MGQMAKIKSQRQRRQQMVLGAEEWSSDCQAVWDLEEEGKWRDKGRGVGELWGRAGREGYLRQCREGSWMLLAQASYRGPW